MLLQGGLNHNFSLRGGAWLCNLVLMSLLLLLVVVAQDHLEGQTRGV
jgi:hypothetical protein